MLRLNPFTRHFGSMELSLRIVGDDLGTNPGILVMPIVLALTGLSNYSVFVPPGRSPAITRFLLLPTFTYSLQGIMNPRIWGGIKLTKELLCKHHRKKHHSYHIGHGKERLYPHTQKTL
jgi:hypothetical protein